MKSNSISYKHRSTIRKLCRFLPIKKFLFFSLYWYKIYFCQVCSDCCQKLYHITRAGVWLKNFNFAQMRSYKSVKNRSSFSLLWRHSFFFRDWNIWIFLYRLRRSRKNLSESDYIIIFDVFIKFFLSFFVHFFLPFYPIFSEGHLGIRNHITGSSTLHYS